MKYGERMATDLSNDLRDRGEVKAADEIERLRRQVRELAATAHRLADAQGRILEWCQAYPLKVFPEPDLDVARQLLEAGGITLDAVSASNMRHVLNGIRKIIEED